MLVSFQPFQPLGECGHAAVLSYAAQTVMYNHTQKDECSYNSRCLDCFMTIASCVISSPMMEQLHCSGPTGKILWIILSLSLRKSEPAREGVV